MLPDRPAHYIADPHTSPPPEPDDIADPHAHPPSNTSRPTMLPDRPAHYIADPHASPPPEPGDIADPRAHPQGYRHVGLAACRAGITRRKLTHRTHINP